jgi:S1-C subfamily serine protease
MTFPRIAAALAACLLGAPALAALPDRSALSFEDNVTINTACFTAHAKGESAFAACVKTQLGAVAAHPAPDRTALAGSRVQTIEANCAYLRRVGLAEYNDCLSKGAAATPPPADGDENDTLASNASLVKVLIEKDAPASAAQPAAAASLPLPDKLLKARPANIGRTTLSSAELFKTVERSVFIVGAARSAADARARDMSQGSAVAIAEHLLLTNCHVVNNRPLIVLLQDKVTWHAKLVAADVENDRCVLESEGAPLVPIAGVRPFADIAVGEHVYAIGAPHALEQTMTEGLVSGKRAQKSRNLIQTSAPISPGSSGGGLFDERGNLLGITTLGSKAGWQNLNFAISAADFWE